MQWVANLIETQQKCGRESAIGVIIASLTIDGEVVVITAFHVATSWHTTGEQLVGVLRDSRIRRCGCAGGGGFYSQQETNSY